MTPAPEMETEAGPGLAVMDGGRGREGPSFAREAEQAVASLCLQGEDEAVASADPDLFLHDGCRKVVQAARRVSSRGDTPDLTLVTMELRSEGVLEEMGGPAFVAELQTYATTDAQIPVYLDELRDAHARRRLREAVREAERDVSEHESAAAATARIEDRLREIREGLPDRQTGPRTIREIREDPDFGTRPAVAADRLAWAGRQVLFAGREKSGKSFLMRWAVARRSRGERVWGGVPMGGPLTTLYYGEEHEDDVTADLYRLGADPDRVLYEDMRSIAGDRIEALARDVETVEPDLVVVDTLARIAAPREPESGASGDWEPIMGELGGLAARSDAAMILNHHANKSDGSYRDSTAIGAGVDCILEMRRSADGEPNRREVTAYPRSGIRVSDYAYVKTGTEDDPRLELVDESLPLRERVLRFVERNQPCSQRAVREGVTGRAKKVKEALQRLDGADEVHRTESGSGFKYTIPENPHGTGTEPPRNHVGTAGTGNGGGGGSEGPPLLRKQEGARNRPAEPVDDDEGEDTDGQEPNVCSSEDCDRRIGPTSTTCIECKQGAGA